MMMMISSSGSSAAKQTGIKRSTVNNNDLFAVEPMAPKLMPMRSSVDKNGTSGKRHTGNAKVLRDSNDVVHKKSANLSPEKVNSRDLRDYSELLETVARVETSRLPAHLISHDEIVNIGALTIHLLFTKEPDRDYNVTYLSTAIKWAVRNELRYRYKWYSFKNTEAESEMHHQSSGIGSDASDFVAGDEDFDDGFAPDAGQLREAVYESILSVDGLMESETPNEIRDGGLTPAEQTEQLEMGRLVRDCMTRLPERERELLEARFFKNMRMREIGQQFGISPSRASRVVQTALTKIKIELQKKGVISH
jgi:RNA polymerase sigma factor (sigma-70 family)